MFVLYLLLACIFMVIVMSEEEKYATVLSEDIAPVCLLELVILPLMWVLNINWVYILIANILIISGYIDYRCQEIPDRLNLILFGLATIYALLYGNIINSLIQVGVYVVLCLVIHFLFNRNNEKFIIGGGDLKLIPSLLMLFSLNGIFYYVLILTCLVILALPIQKIRKAKEFAFCPLITIAFIIYSFLLPELILL